MFFKRKEQKVENKIYEPDRMSKDLDIVEIPIEAVAAYWLSLKKVGQKNLTRLIKNEKEYTSERYIKHILDLFLSSFDEEKLRIYANYKKRYMLKELNRRFVILSIGVLGIATKENPQQVIIRIMSKFPLPPESEMKIYKNAQLLVTQYEDKEDIFVDIYYNEKPEILIRNLMFYLMIARKMGISRCIKLGSRVRSHYFKEGLSLIADGFDYDFIKYRLNLQKNEILYHVEQKMDMSIEMAIALRKNYSYEDMFKIANSFLL